MLSLQRWLRDRGAGEARGKERLSVTPWARRAVYYIHRLKGGAASSSQRAEHQTHEGLFSGLET